MRGAVLLVAVAALVAPVVATAADGEPKKALTKAGQTTARSVVLKRADLGSGFTSVARAKDQHLPKAARCGVARLPSEPDRRVRHGRLDGSGVPHPP